MDARFCVRRPAKEGRRKATGKKRLPYDQEKPDHEATELSVMSKTRNSIQSQEKEQTERACAHCGDPCGRGAPEKEGRLFCCAGCLTVYDLLHEQGLNTYYALEEQPGLRPDRGVTPNRLAYLDRDNIRL